MSCSFCEKIEHTDWSCSNNHFVCEDCRLADPDDLIIRVTEVISFTNPFDIANIIMHHPTFRSHGIEHHLVVAPSIIVALNNAKLIDVPENRIKSAIKRTINIPYGSCGSRGDCGASIGSGVTVSLITRATYKSEKERALVMEATGKSLIALANKGGTRCCKESVYSAIESTLTFLNEQKLITFPQPNFSCEFKYINECKKEQCTYYEK